VDFDFTVTITPNEAVFRDAISENVANLFENHKPGDNILISQFSNAIASSGVTDFQINSVFMDSVPQLFTADFVLVNFQYPKLGTATYL